MIKQQQATVWLAPTKGRRYFSRKAAIKAEARALIYVKHPVEEGCPRDGFCDCGDRGYMIEHDEPERYAKMHRRMSRLLEAATPKKVKP